jgi:hypothetical protein
VKKLMSVSWMYHLQVQYVEKCIKNLVGIPYWKKSQEHVAEMGDGTKMDVTNRVRVVLILLCGSK